MKHIHFIGICGVAMSALATAFHKEGWNVTGSDVGFFPPISDYLKNNGIKFYPGWHVEKMIAAGAPDVVVVGNVAGSANPEFLYARKHNLNYKSYPEIISEYIVQKNSIVCAGTYGKTTTAALLAFILEKAGKNPLYMFGGLSLNMPMSAKIKNKNNISDKDDENDIVNNWSVLEGDEYKTARWDSRPKFKLYSPTHLLLTSVFWDHADIYPTEETYLQAFKDLILMIPSGGLIAAGSDFVNVNKILSANVNGAKIVRYGKSQTMDYFYHDVKQASDGVLFKIKTKHKEHEIKAPVLGEHMAENICGAFALAKELNIDEQIIIGAIKEFKGVKRRLEKRYEGKITIFDDLAHSPTKAAAALKTLRAIFSRRKITAVFEPNIGNRKIQSAPGYANAFSDADEVIVPALTKIKIDTKDIDPPFDGKKLQEIISKTHKNVLFIASDEELVAHIKKTAKDGDVAVFLGSHGWRGMIEELISQMESR